MPLLSAAELAGFEVFGENVRVVRGERIVEPAAGGNAVRALLRVGVVESEERVARVLAEIGVETETARVFMSQREVVRLPAEMGGTLEARPIIPGLDFDSLSNYTASDAGYDVDVEFGAPAVIDDSERKYKLGNLFRDTTLSDKLGISARRMQSAKRLALSDPAASAAALTDYIREHGFPNSRVLAGDYARTVNNAIDFVHAMGRTITYADSAAPAVVTHTQLQITFDQFHLKEPAWTVMGPLKYATEVNIVYQLAIHYGPEHVLFMLGSETLRLGIDIRNERTGLCYTGAVNGYSSLSGIHPGGYGFPPELTADQQARLLVAGRKVSPVYVGDAVIGSAVHVSDKHAILNEHTLAAAAQNDVVPMLCGQPIEESMSVSGDVCVVRRDGVHAQWLFREPDIGERVVLCYSVGNTVEYSEVLQVLGCSGELVLSGSNILRRGASGAAVIALRDSALLGIFSTMRASKVLCALFTSSSFAVVSDCQSVASVSQYAGTPGVDAGNQTYARMVKRGLLGFLEHIERSVASLYVGTGSNRRLAGLVANVAGEWHTTVDPDVAQLSMVDGRQLAFETSAVGTYTAQFPPPVLQAVPNVRAVDPGERVFVFTKVDDDVIMSSVRMVTHCLSDNRGFVVEDFGDSDEVMMGGLIVAERDAAVLGMYTRRDYDAFGVCTVYCVSLYRPSVATVGTAGILDVVAIHTELTSWILPAEETFNEYVTYGRAVWEVAVGRRAYRAGGNLSRAAVVSYELWVEKSRAVMDLLGWLPTDTSSYERRGFDSVALAFLAMVYLRDGNYANSKLDTVLDSVVVGATPITGSFPFPRASSATGSVTSTRTAVESESQRLQELEERMRRLAEMVATRDKRLSDPVVDGE